MTSPTPVDKGIATATKILAFIGACAGALTAYLGGAGDTQAALIVGGVAVVATAGAHFTG
jgi:hypothetical protein